jgi:hypothetical protein
VRKFKVGDVISSGIGGYAHEVTHVVEGSANITARWADGVSSYNVKNCYVVKSVGSGLSSWLDFEEEGLWIIAKAEPVMRKFKAGDVIEMTIGPKVTNTVVRVIEGTQKVRARWIYGDDESEITDSYLLYDKNDECHYVSPFANEGWWSLIDPSMGLSRGDLVEIRHKWGVGTDGPYELVEAVYTERTVSYDWCGSLKHPRLVKDCWIAKTDSDEYIIIDFCELPLVRVLTAPKCAGFCPRCGEKMVEKMSTPFIGGEEFKVKKCVSCHNCL